MGVAARPLSFLPLLVIGCYQDDFSNFHLADGGADSRSNDGAIADAATFNCDGGGGPSKCGSAGTVVCEDFETNFPGTLWSTFMGGVDSSFAFRGAKSYHFTSVASQEMNIGESMLVPAPDIYVRAFVYVKSAPVNQDCILMSLYYATGSPTPPGLGLTLINGQLGSWNGVAASAPYTVATDPVPTDCWTCFEWHVRSDHAGLIELWIDDKLEATSTVQDTLPAQGFLDTVHFAWVCDASGIDVWFDEIAIDSKPIGCAR